MLQHKKQGKNNKTGAFGEQIAVNYLKRRGFTVLDVNYLKKWGEIDIIAHNSDNVVHFIEVKTVSYETKKLLDYAVTHETWRPEEQVHAFKLKKLSRVIESWIMEKSYEGDWKIDVIAVRVVPREKDATVKYIPNIIDN